MTIAFPGGTQCSRVSLYGDLATDICGGTPHLHTACTEAYVWLRGHGTLELLSGSGHHVVPAEPFTAVWFSPGVIHRGIPAEGVDDAEVLVVMQNAGLPEAGDAVLTLPERMWGEPDDYRRAVGVSAPDVETARELVRHRRALAIEGLRELVAAVDRLGPAGLDGFYAFAHHVVRPNLGDMAKLVEQQVVPVVDDTLDVLERMKSGSFAHLRTGEFRTTAAPANPRFGMCGELRPIPLDGDET